MARVRHSDYRADVLVNPSKEPPVGSDQDFLRETVVRARLRDAFCQGVLPDQLSHTVANGLQQYRLPVLRRPHQVQVDLKDRVRSVPVSHPTSLRPHSFTANRPKLLKFSPEGEGFNPPKVGQ